MSYRQLTEIKVKFSSELTWTFLKFAQGVTSTHGIMAAGIVALQEFYKFDEVIPPYASRCEPNPDREKEAACSYDFFFSTVELHGPYSAHCRWPQPKD